MSRQPIYSADELVARAIAIAGEGRRMRVAVAAAAEASVIDAAAQARDEGFVDAILCGDKTQIEKLAEQNEIDLSGLTIEDAPDLTTAVRTAARLAAEGAADILMKGFLPTPLLLRTLLDHEFDLRARDLLSHCAVLDIPRYHKLLTFTDGGMVVQPDKETKYKILENAVVVARALGLSPVRIAVSAAHRLVTDKVPHTQTDVAYLIPEAESRLEDIAIQGPLSIDLATSGEAAQAYGVTGAVVGDADIFLVDSIEECNILCKSLIHFAEAVFAGVIVGTRVPIALVSRTDSARSKKCSLALACVLSDYYGRANLNRTGGNRQ